ncbi:MAG TPA: tripartite tricarboxylate transporter substrate binding protein [Candidatus Lachnoclostridium stercoravium]|uniref:Tripartite tricarboxylate transporter substrate binding protein n=1 Tax=Candidatus Lachnoclostridium stercoravium TaxID=2838633 RepID=A0A9D2HKT9_9FIRM|nr:tripartite tricarboxylate transporter substrate binding protein [Candidatus Lachnoclostridium stercoravium]
MKKKILATILAGTMALSLAACGGSETASETTAAPAAESGSEAAAEGGDAAAASDWKPEGTVSIVVPAGAGGDTDLSARVFAQYAKELTGVDFIVVNSNGAAGSVAANQVLESAPDGMTCLYGHALVNVANIAGVTDYNYTAFKIGPSFALEPAQQFYTFTDKYPDLDSFIEAAKAAPGQLKACTEVGAYTYYELLGFEKAAGIDLDLVDAGSTSDKIAAMLSGQIDLMPGPYVNCKDYLETGDFTCIGVPTEERYDITKDLPTLKEQGIDYSYPNQEFSFYFPKETPDEVITWYDNLVKQILDSEEGKQALADLQMEPNYKSPADTEKTEEETFNTIKAIADELEAQ